MNRENKRKQYQKGYYKTHACEEDFTCKVCGRPVVPAGAGSDHRNHCPSSFTPTGTPVRTACPACMWTMSRATVPPTAAALWTPSVSGSTKTVSGQ